MAAAAGGARDPADDDVYISLNVELLHCLQTRQTAAAADAARRILRVYPNHPNAIAVLHAVEGGDREGVAVSGRQ